MAIMTPQASFLMWLLFSLVVPDQVNQPAPSAARMYRYVPQQSQLCASVHTAALSKDFDLRLQKALNHPLIKFFPRGDYALKRFQRRLKRVRRDIFKEIRKDFFKELEFVNLCVSVSNKQPKLGVLHFGMNYSEEDFRAFTQKKSNTRVVSAHGFLVAMRDSSRETMVRTPEGELLLVNKSTARTLIQKGPSVFQNQKMQRLMTQHHRSEMIAAVGIVMTSELQQTVQDTVGMATNLFAGWQSFHASTSLTHLKVQLNTSNEEITRRSKLFFEGLHHMGMATALYGEGIYHGLQGILDMPNPEQRSPFVRNLVRNKEYLFALMRMYMGNKNGLSIKIQQHSNHLVLESIGPLNRIWTLAGIALVGQNL